jgi:hypothetical protein
MLCPARQRRLVMQQGDSNRAKIRLKSAESSIGEKYLQGTSASHSEEKRELEDLLAGKLALEVDKAAFETLDYRLGSIGDVEPHENNADVRFDGGFLDSELFGDLAVAFALKH